MADNSTQANIGGGLYHAAHFTGMLQVAFIVLKLTGHIDWSWWWVFAPTWGSLALCAIIALIVLAFVAIADAVR